MVKAKSFQVAIGKKTTDILLRSKVGQTLMEETSRAGSELQIAREQEAECRQVFVHYA